MNYTILSIKQSELLEKLIVKYGQIQTSRDIIEEAKDNWDHQQAKNLITKMVKNGWFMRIKMVLCHFGFKIAIFVAV